jgi:putative flippase GtrA
MTQTKKNKIKNLENFFERHQFIYQFLRYAVTGFLNTALNFLILNIVSKALNINHGFSLALIAGLAFAVSVVQSYFWNRVWAFGNEGRVSLRKNLTRIFSVGLLGLVTLVLILVASKFSVIWEFYALLTVVYFAFEWVLWNSFGFHKADFIHVNNSFNKYFFVTFIGLLINAGLVWVITSNFHFIEGDLNKNIAVIMATTASFLWNFTSYKLMVFK